MSSPGLGVVPPSMICPITHGIMENPVMDKDGYSYEKAAIIQWVTHSGTSPVTRKPLALTDLTPNRALMDAIEEFKNNGVAPTWMGSQTHERESVHNIQPPTMPTAQLQMKHSVIPAPDNPDDILVHVTLEPPKMLANNQRPPCDICMVIDTSGSMNAEAKLKNEDGNEEGDGLSMLDVVKHGVKTVMGVLKPIDRLAVVQYASRAKVVHRLRNMNEENKKMSTELVEELLPNGTTNLWDGLKTGLEVLREDSEGNRTQCIMLLTDGVPNIEPPRGHLPMLKKYYKLHPQMRACILNTFGFGYTLNSELLAELAEEGQGAYGFIPDVGLVGTIFIHAISNTLTTISKSVEVEFIPSSNEVTLNADAILGGMRTTEGQGMVTTVKLGSVRLGQSKDIIVRMPKRVVNGECFLGVSAEYVDACSGKTQECEMIEVETLRNTPEPGANTIFHYFRLKAASAIRALSRRYGGLSNTALDALTEADIATAVSNMKAVIQEARTSGDARAPLTSALLVDLEGQCSEAFSRMDWFKRWGRHYLPSLMFAHLNQQCNNFKDPGVQNYGGEMFENIRDEADDIFEALPPPVSTRVTPQSQQQQLQQQQQQQQHGMHGTTSRMQPSPAPVQSRQPVQMSRYNCSNAPCFAGHCLVDTAAGAIRVDAIKKGDRIVTEDGSFVSVVCVVVTKITSKKAFFVKFPSGLWITPYHPVFVDSLWRYPQDVHPVFEESCDVVYNFVLESSHVMMVAGVPCITLGHEKSDNHVIQHSYLGTRKVVEDLARCTGWTEGVVYVESMVRDPMTKRICGIVSNPAGQQHYENVLG